LLLFDWTSHFLAFFASLLKKNSFFSPSLTFIQLHSPSLTFIGLISMME